MDEETKRRFEALIELWKQPWQRISERRSSEWRVAFTLWTALAGFIGLLVKYGPQIHHNHETYGFAAIVAIGVFICFIHGWYLGGLGEAHYFD
jgi:hypothetical protein